MWFILGCGEHPVNTSHAKLDREHEKRKLGLESLRGPVAQWQSTRLITGGAQVRILLGPPLEVIGQCVASSLRTLENRISMTQLSSPQHSLVIFWLLPYADSTGGCS